MFLRFFSKSFWLTLLFFIILSLIFFYPIFRGSIPFPGDLLIGEYSPYNSYEFHGYTPGGYPNKGQGFDVLRLVYPAKEYTINMLMNLQMPLWDPYIFSGTPHLAALQSGVFYIFKPLYVLFDFNISWTIQIILQPILSGIFTYLFLREYGLRWKGAVFGSTAFAYSLYNTVWIEYGNFFHTILWLPLAMYLTLKLLKNPSINKVISIAVVLSFSIVAGYIQTSFYVFLFVFFFGVYHISFQKNRRRLFLYFISAIFLPLLLTAVQLIPTVELILQSSRSSYSIANMHKLLIPIFHIISIFIPDFFGNPATKSYWLEGTYIERVSYIGILPLFFALFSFSKNIKRQQLFFIISALVGFLLGYNTIVSSTIYSFQIPFISTAVPTRIMFMFCFSLSVLCAYGYEAFERNEDKRKLLSVIFLFSVIFTSSLFITFLVGKFVKDPLIADRLNIAFRNTVLPAAIFFGGMLSLGLLYTKRRYSLLLFSLLLLLTIIDLFYIFQKITPFAPLDTVYPQTQIAEKIRNIQGFDRTWGFGSARFDTNFNLHERIYGTDGYDALHIKRYGEFISASKNGIISLSPSGTIAEIEPSSDPFDFRQNQFRQTMLNLLGVKYVLYRDYNLTNTFQPHYEIFPEDKYHLVWQKTPFQIYENKKVLPRFFLTSSYIVESDRQKIVDEIFKSANNKTIVLEENVPSIIKLQTDPNAKIKLISYTPNRNSFISTAATDMLFFISDAYYEGWKVNIDQQPAKIYRANYSFRAVVVPAGKHTLIFTYAPQSYYFGLLISEVTIGLIFIVLILGNVRSYVKK